jgi:isoamylase
MRDWYSLDGAPEPLGATWIPDEQAWNFALYSRHASQVTLLLYASDNLATPVRELRPDYKRQKTGRVWHCRVSKADVPSARYYGYHVEGPFAPAQGDRFDSQKVLLDPYATSVLLPLGFSRQASTGAGSNAGGAPLGELPQDVAPFDWGNDVRPHHGHDTVIYEMHVRGFTKRANSGVSAGARSLFAGVIEKIPYLQDLGVTVVELMPVFLFDPEPGGNYWGYMPLSFFAPHHAYTAVGTGIAAINEFKAMVKALHAADIEVVLDVVFNHTSELGADGATYCYRGIDNSTYYLLGPNGTFRNDAGTGNVLRTAHPAVRRLIADSLRYWVREMHVDGFRFDLASIFTRNDQGEIVADEPPIIAELSSDPCFADIRLIAEPWGGGSYDLGRAFPGTTWAQWNGKYRDEMRSFMKGTGRVGDVMTRVYGSTDLFPDALADSYRPQQSVNFITCHDGFCLYDIVAYANKHNQGNGWNNTDGTDANYSWNWGTEGDDGASPETLVLRRRLVKNFCCLLMISNGTPMFVAGDEFMNTQRGNNNPYNQDNETTWLNWDRLQANADVFRFFKNMIAFRRAHRSIGRGRFWSSDVRWYGVDGAVNLADWSHALAFFLSGAAEGDDDLYVMINAYWDDLTFTIQEGQHGSWRRIVDTARPSPDDFVEGGVPVNSSQYRVGARSLAVLVRPKQS